MTNEDLRQPALAHPEEESMTPAELGASRDSGISRSRRHPSCAADHANDGTHRGFPKLAAANSVSLDQMAAFARAQSAKLSSRSSGQGAYEIHRSSTPRCPRLRDPGLHPGEVGDDV